ncbi:hypothetical protein Syun_024810 [Stephania yunnanensis]|uniref:Uncharacterized protein n=1 Tax=Stephania yunnanensis TaxID=152371 RepID=A0AAP0EQG0_9MAGN
MSTDLDNGDTTPTAMVTPAATITTSSTCMKPQFQVYSSESNRWRASNVELQETCFEEPVVAGGNVYAG